MAAFGCGVAQAQQAAAPASPHTITGNVGFFSQYIFRGLTQTDRDPALQGGFDYSHSSGFYAGTWGSNISWLRDSAAYSGGGSLEWDFYGGYKMSLGKDVTLDFGTLYYWYPGDPNVLANPLNPKADTWEVYVGAGWKWFTGKFSYVVSNKAFGVLDASGTWYLDLGVAVPIGSTGLTFDAHYGIQKYTGTDARNPAIGGLPMNNDSIWSYEDWRVGVSYALPKDFTIGAYYTDTTGSSSSGTNFAYGQLDTGGPYPNNVGKGTGTIYIKKTF
jgi:uncharacterized protein (TIGR02001 family)